MSLAIPATKYVVRIEAARFNESGWLGLRGKVVQAVTEAILFDEKRLAVARAFDAVEDSGGRVAAVVMTAEEALKR